MHGEGKRVREKMGIAIREFPKLLTITSSSVILGALRVSVVNDNPVHFAHVDTMRGD